MKKTIILLTAALSLIACKIKESKKVVYTADWESLKQHETPQWFADAKFGIYFHWGPYSVPAHKTEWYSHWMYVPGHPIRKYHEETYGPLNEFGYKDFIPMFKAEKFDPTVWAKLFRKAGARFAGPVAEHADGFAMWDSDLTEFDAMDMGPKCDIVGEMEKAVRAEGMKFITTLHHSWLYGWYTTWDENTDASNPRYEDLYGPKVPPSAWAMAKEEQDPMPGPDFNKRWIDRCIEVVDKYQPDLVYFDNRLDIIQEQKRKEFVSYYYNKGLEWGKDVAVTYKFTDMAEGAAIFDFERSRSGKMRKSPWLTDDSIDWGTWCHTSTPDYKTTNRIIDFLVDVVSKNGCVLLNITPTAEGVIPQGVVDRLLEIGAWLDLNGEAIYETRPWKIFGEGPLKIVEGHLSENENNDATAEDIRFTTKGSVLYALLMDWPEEGTANIKSLGTNAALLEKEIINISMPGSNEKLSWERGAEALSITLPTEKPCEHSFALKITTK